VVFIFTESHIGWAHDWSENETDMYEFAYTVENDEVSISSLTPVKLVVSPREINSAMTEKSDALIEAQKQINELTAQIAELAPYKEAAEQAAREKAEAERKEKVDALRAYAEESGMVSKEELESGEIAEMIENLKETDLKVLISDRIVAKQKKYKPAETASVKQKSVRTDIFSISVEDNLTRFREKLGIVQ
jgi:macrodomain Ter protein organizer (MatP/YcbG family)